MAPDSSESSARSYRKPILVVIAVILSAYIIYDVSNPYRGQRYEEIPHGDHVHYVPRDRNPDVPVGEFPTQPPGPDERILPDGRVVPADAQ